MKHEDAPSFLIKDLQKRKGKISRKLRRKFGPIRYLKGNKVVIIK